MLPSVMILSSESGQIIIEYQADPMAESAGEDKLNRASANIMILEFELVHTQSRAKRVR